MEIEGRELDQDSSYLEPVTFVPNHADGNAGHPDCEQGVIIKVIPGLDVVRILYSKTRTVQSTNPDNLVWG